MQTDQHLYTLTRSEFAKEIGKSREAVKQDMRRGKYKQLYIFVDGKYKFKTREAVRENKGTIPIEVYPSNKRKINRGGHESAIKKGRYPNQAFANHNTMKKFLSAKGKLTPEQLRLVPEIESKVLAEHQRLKVQDYESKLPPRDTSRSSLGVYTSGLFNESNSGYSDPYYHNGRAHLQHPNKFKESIGRSVEDKAYPYWKPKYY